MYIKQIIIQGFKSYKDQTVIEPFSPGTNVVVGRNGSGKSNFFAAIRFVLSDAYSNLGREERQALLHEGSGSAVMSAYVEVIFDNSDERFPTNGKEVTLRRTISLKKDEWSIDKKAVTKKEVINMLESAGFSKSNPYYIVPQGRVTTLTNMKESERLALMKEVAGTKVYEERRTESLKIMADTNHKREQIDALLQSVKDKLDELEEEKDELRDYQNKDRERRCLEYAYYHQEQMLVNDTLEKLDDDRQNGIDQTDEQRDVYTTGEKVISQLDSEIHKLQQQLELLRLDKRQLDEDRKEASRAKAKAELAVKSLSDSASAQQQARDQHDAEMEEVRAAIASKEAELAKITPEYEKRKRKEAEIKQQLDQAEASRQRLFTKQSRSSQFKTKAERDAWLKKEIDELNITLSQQKANLLDADEEVKDIEKSIKQLETEVAELRARNEGFGAKRTALADEVTNAKDIYDKLDEERKLLRREDDKLETIRENCRAEMGRAEKELSHTMDGATSRGLANIRRMRQEQNIEGAYGTLAELMTVSEAYRVAVEQIAGASLFHYVVDNEQTATYFVNQLEKTRGGRVTFMPLNKLHPRPANLPRASDAVPLISKIEFDPQFEMAFQQVFGQSVLCPNLTVAGQYARTNNVDCITPDGDIAAKKGSMTGGYIDPSKSRLEAVRAVSKLRDEYEELVNRSSDIRKNIEKKDQEITRATGEQKKLDLELRKMDDGYSSMLAELNAKNNQIVREQDRLEAAMKRRDAVDRNMKDFGEILSAHEAELASDFKKALSATEERQLEDLSSSVRDLQKQWNDTSSARREMEGRKQILEVELRSNLRLKLDQLTVQAFEGGSSRGSGDLKEARRELKKAQTAATAIERKIQATEEQIDAAAARIENLEEQKATKETEQQALAREIAKQQRKMEKSIQKKALLQARAADASKTIRDLGAQARLMKVKEALKKYQHINKKALDQYNSFTTEQDRLLKRRKELDQSQESIEELVAHLDQRKDEAIERTFKQVSKEFATIFEKLVPAGHGRLVIQRRADRRMDPEDSDEEQRGSIENYTGVGISVSFNSKTQDEQQRIQQLSGGQKSLCALCLIFALQQAESSPMVIFDEVDANLDAQYRTAVASLLESISKEAGTQFIITTFRPEIVHVADKCYGVLFRNKNSNINVVSTEQALDFVENQAPR
ncbi:RecF/RecN/SMC N terminal domain-containing protein [Apiospora rasikravindrae]|uniref:Structural maintenance of chromosomes protein n=1 Tax=Apiospora rasikravindrae TaxID=990691 RepID=A0ABR1RYE6_9PEZI